MQQFLSSIRFSTKTQNWFSALFMALAIPDICAALEDGETSGARYKNWFNRYLKNEYNPDPPSSLSEFLRVTSQRVGVSLDDGNMSAEEIEDWKSQYERTIINMNATAFTAETCYKFRCKTLHQGLSEGVAGQKIEFSPPVVVSIHRCFLDGVYVIDINMFCIDMCNAVEQWLTDKSGDANVQLRISELMSIKPIKGIGNNFYGVF